MITNEFVPKSELLAQLRSIFNNKESGMLTLLTQSKQSVLMRFSEGQLTSARCKNWDIENTISALLETESLKYSYMPSAGEDKPPLISPDDFMMMIDPGGTGLEDVTVDESNTEELTDSDTVDTAQAQQETVANKVSDEAQDAAEQAGKHVDRAIAAKMNYF